MMIYRHHPKAIPVRLLVGVSLVLLAVGLLLMPQATQADNDYIMVLDANGAIVPAMATYIERGLEQADRDSVALVILRLDTPGGNVNTMEEIIQDIRGSDIPVIVYVAPNGATAGSAGALIALAGHRTAMAPETVIGAASPINADGSDIYATAEQKVRNILVATVQSLTENRSPEAQAVAERMVTDAEAIAVNDALAIGLIDYIAADNQDLIRQLDGTTITVKERDIVLNLTGLEIRTVKMNLLEQFLLILTDPTIVFSLLSLGMLLIILEFSVPGGWVAGIVGATSVLLSLYGLGVLPINWLGFVLVIAAVVMIGLEVQMPGTQGFLSVGAAICLALGGYILFSRPEIAPFGQVPIYVILGESVLFAGFGMGIVYLAMQSRHQPPITGEQGMIGLVGEVRRALEPRGTVFVHGELWQAETSNGAYINSGEAVEIVEVVGLLLRVMTADPDARHKAPPKPPAD